MNAFRAPRRGLGQNFLVDRNIQDKIVERLAITPEDHIVEIGPGRGALTRGLIERARHVVLVEKDDDLAAFWQRETAELSHVRVLHADILTVSIAGLGPPGHVRVVGNIPYNITAPILFHALERPRPLDVVVMVQREVATRILAAPGTREYGALSVGVRAVARPERLLDVSRGAFKPRPNVDSTVLRIVPEANARMTPDMEERLRRLTRAVFGWRRKKLRTVLRDHAEFRFGGPRAESVLERAGIDPDARGETLSPARFIQLAEAVRDAERDTEHDTDRDVTPDLGIGQKR